MCLTQRLDSVSPPLGCGGDFAFSVSFVESTRFQGASQASDPDQEVE